MSEKIPKYSFRLTDNYSRGINDIRLKINSKKIKLSRSTLFPGMVITEINLLTLLEEAGYKIKVMDSHVT